MKKIVLLFALLFVCATSSAQESKHEVNLGYGIVTTNTVINSFSDFLALGLTGGHYQAKNKTFMGSVNVGYKYALTERVSLGGTFAYEKISADAYYGDVKDGRSKNQYYTIAPELDFKYVKGDIFTLYSLIGAGGTIVSRDYTSTEGVKTDESSVNFNFQVTPIGVKLGKSVGVYGELGFGYKGLLNFGLFAKF